MKYINQKINSFYYKLHKKIIYADAGCGIDFLDHSVEMVNPLMICHTPHHAAITAIPPNSSSGGKIFGLKIKTSAIPEFCIPVSIVIVFLFKRDSLINLAALNPVVNANKL